MTKKRQIESNKLSTADEACKRAIIVKPMTFNEVAAIIQSGDSDKLNEVIEAGRVSDINMKCDNGMKSFLMVACKKGFIECTRVLLDYNADINYRSYNESVLRSACLSGSVDMIRFVIDRGIIINDGILLSLFVLDEIACNTEIATILVGYIQNFNYDGSRATFLYQACKAGNVRVARIMLERGASVIYQYYDPIVIAARNGHLEVVKLLVGWNDTSMAQESVNGALSTTSSPDHKEVACCSEEYWTDAEAINNSLYTAVAGGHIEVAVFLLDSGADFNMELADYGCSTWLHACRRANHQMMRLLLDRGADPNAVTASGESPFQTALSHPEALRILLENGADPNQILDSTGETPLMTAALDLDVDLVKLLLEYGADVTQVNREGKSVLDMLGRTRKYGQVRELCTQYIDSNKLGAKLLLK